MARAMLCTSCKQRPGLIHSLMSADTLSLRKTISIIGAGFSGTMVAVHLLERAEAPLRIFLIERRPPAGCGVAYGTRSSDHLLNVPVERMGAWPDDPEHFLRWLRDHRGEPEIPDYVAPGDFLPRRLFGEYVGSLLADAQRRAADGVELIQITGEVVDIEEQDGGGILRLSDGQQIASDQVVLALGNLPGEYPIPRPLPIYHSPRYVHVPWRGDVLDNIGTNDDVLLVGQGLTATDLIVQLERRGHRGTVHALSRNGQRPQVHKVVTPYPYFLEPIPSTVRELVRRVRAELKTAAAQGIDWRAVLDSLRPQSQAIWQALSWSERAKFLRYIRPFWEGHRHRVAPQLSAILDRMAAEGRLKFHPGRLQVLEEDATGVQALFRRRGSIQHVALRVAKVINCTGPRTDYSKYQHPLFIHLLARGLIDHDPLALGINAHPGGEVLRYRGEAVGWLFTLGAPLKGILWETTGVREIRVEALALAERLLDVGVAT
jgi:uncharacterized NAD(P)/FAD-binding protein YdhS